MKSGLFAVIFIQAVILASFTQSWADTATPTLAPSEARAIETVIRSQLRAFQKDHASAAYQHASPMIRGMFPDPEVFVNMVRRGYPQIYRSQQAIFARPTNSGGRILQPVTVIGKDGIAIRAIYHMLRQQNGRWLINGVYTAAAPGTGS